MTETDNEVALDGDWLVLSLSAQAVAVIRRAAGDLAVAIEDKRANEAWWSFRTPMHLFPEAYESRRDQKAYIQRHELDIRAELTAAAHRVIAALDAGRPMRYPAAQADDLLRVFGSARLLYVDRDAPPSSATPKAAAAYLLSAMQHEIVVTLRPELAGVGPQ
ncbi:DUF2017 family protein [Kutzneria chonburiensis]|uniref:Uncharacterized protein n=1 Tax=Kutzneria chonburiensis TaxID=1483604 RepID=A0ABV6N6A6_9PSEU|nr:hypothetical protein [Kutzneria chonburiensis]